MTDELGDEENTPLGLRMKAYEHTFRYLVPRRTYTLMRLDGVAFHTYLRNAEKPFDRTFMSDMNMTALYLCELIDHAQFAYVQSDEISLLLTDFYTTRTEPWYGGGVQKMVSVSASRAGAYFARLRYHLPGLPCFDSRVWSMSDPVEVANYFVWRQRDAVRNSIQMVGQHYFTQAQLHGKSTAEVQEMLWITHQVNWSKLPPECKRGRIVLRDPSEGRLVVAAPHFTTTPGEFLANHVPALPSLT